MASVCPHVCPHVCLCLHLGFMWTLKSWLKGKKRILMLFNLIEFYVATLILCGKVPICKPRMIQILKCSFAHGLRC
jgi:hypothetical protein